MSNISSNECHVVNSPVELSLDSGEVALVFSICPTLEESGKIVIVRFDYTADFVSLFYQMLDDIGGWGGLINVHIIKSNDAHENVVSNINILLNSDTLQDRRNQLAWKNLSDPRIMIANRSQIFFDKKGVLQVNNTTQEASNQIAASASNLGFWKKLFTGPSAVSASGRHLPPTSTAF